MNDEPPNESSRRHNAQYSLRTLFKLTAWSAALIYILWNSWDHLGFTLLMFIVFSPFIFFSEIVDWLLGVKRS